MASKMGISIEANLKLKQTVSKYMGHNLKADALHPQKRANRVIVTNIIIRIYDKGHLLK